MSIARVRVEAGQTTKPHFLENTMERYVILSGDARVTVDGSDWTVNEGDVVVIEPGFNQKIENLTAQDLVFLAICTPRFEEKNYRET